MGIPRSSHFTDCLPSKSVIREWWCGGTGVIFAIQVSVMQRTPSSASFFAGDITGESASALDGQKAAVFPASHAACISEAERQGECSHEIFHLAVKIVTVCFVVIDGSLPADQSGMKMA